MRKLSSPFCISIVATLLLCLSSSDVFSQSNKKPKLKDFGSSLKRLKWDPQQNAAIETERQGVEKALAVLSTVTGGWIEFFDQPSQADEIYSRIFSDINRRYIVGYYPTNKEHDGKRRNISIAVREHPEYLVIGRKAYYAPEPDN